MLKITALPSPAKAVGLGAILALVGFVGYPLIGSAVFLVACLRAYWSFGSDRVRLRWLFWALSALGLAAALVLPAGWALGAVALGYALALWAAFALFEFQIPNPDFWHQFLSTIVVWAAAVLGYHFGYPALGPLLPALAAAVTTREYLSCAGPRFARLSGAAVGVIAFETFRLAGLLPLGTLRGAAVVALVAGFVRDVARGASAGEGFRAFSLTVFGILLLAAVSSWDLS